MAEIVLSTGYVIPIEEDPRESYHHLVAALVGEMFVCGEGDCCDRMRRLMAECERISTEYNLAFCGLVYGVVEIIQEAQAQRLESEAPEGTTLH